MKSEELEKPVVPAPFGAGSGSGSGRDRMSSRGRKPEAGVVVVAPRAAGVAGVALAVVAAAPVAGSSEGEMQCRPDQNWPQEQVFVDFWRQNIELVGAVS